MTKPDPSEKTETVILLHGLGPAIGNMAMIERTLRKAGYATLNVRYPSLQHDIEALAAWLDRQAKIKQVWENSTKIHFVTLSMGGLVLEHYLNTHRTSIPAQKMGRVVMLGPPHGGSEMADLLQKTPFFRVAGPAGRQLTTSRQKQNTVRPWYELGIIAGKRFSGGRVMRSAHDGCVTVESTKMEGMKDHIALPSIHAFLGWNKKMRQQILNFLKNGKFDHE